ncbi:MAG: OmpH family outer membrane protein [Paracoccaceae bacterium]|nr:OmpH family outer membrane protein [Paracoccaceae bacterium]
MRIAPAAAGILWLLVAGTMAQAQTAPTPTTPTTPAPSAVPTAVPAAGASAVLPSSVLTIDQDRLFANTKYGKRLERDYEAAAAALATENRGIEAELSTEERALTDKRATLAPDDFRKLADAFDTKVEGIRKAQAAKNTELLRQRDEARQKFFEEVLPVLGGLMRENGAVAILNAQAVFLSFKGIDITDRAIARIDASLGEGSPASNPGPTIIPAPTSPATPTAPAPASGVPATQTAPAPASGN